MRIFRLLSAGVSVLAFATMAQAQEEQPSAAAQARDGIQDIVVTARRSAEAVQSVPVSITALSGEFLDRQNVVDPTALQQFAPSLTFAQQPSSLSAAAVFIRGIGNQEPSAVSEQGVGIYLDGVYLARSAGSVFDLIDLERVEVLRGPQGTLFGRNTIGGAIQLVSRKPTDDFKVSAKTGYARFNEWFLRSRVDTGYIGGSTIKASISAQHRQADGYVNNVLAKGHSDPGSINAESVAIGLQGEFGNLTANYNFDFDQREGTPAFFQIIAATQDVRNYFGASPGFGGAPFQISQKRLDDVQSVGFNDRFRSRTRISGHALTLNYDISPEMTLKSITGYRKFYQNTILSLSGNGDLRQVVLDPVTFAPSIAPVGLYNGQNSPQRQHQFSQEFQALGTIGDVSYLAGLYYFREKASEYNQQALTFVLPGGQAGLNLTPIQAFGGTSKSKAAFGQVSWKPGTFDQNLEITGGIRYTEDTKTAFLAGDINPTLRGGTKSNNVSWLASLSYKVTPDTLLYGRVSTGYRSGGVNPRALSINTFGPEKVNAYEVGIKADLLDRHLRLNLSGFLTDYDDLQVTQFAADASGASTIVVNAGKVQLKGFEAEVTALPIGGLTLDGSVSYIDTNYKTFLFRDPTTNILRDVANDARPVYTPTWTWRIGGEYAHDFSFGTGRLRIDYSRRTTIYFNALDSTSPFNSDIRARPSENLKARISVEDFSVGGSKVEFGAWGDNLTNQKVTVYGIDFGSLGFAGALFKKPISYGFDVRFTY